MQEYFDYLVELRDSGETNMWWAPSYLESEFGLSKNESIEVFKKWIQSLTEPQKA